MASDVIFTEGSQTAATATREVEAARTAEHDALESTRFAVRKQEAIVLAAAAGVVAIAVLVLIPSARRAQDDTSASGTISIAPSVVTPTAQTQPQAAAAPAPVVQASPVPQNSAATDTLKAAAALATDFGRVRDLPDLQRLLARAAEAMDASGVMVWIGSPAGNDLRPVLAHGYPEDMLARIPPVPRTADNAAAKAYRSGTLQIVLARPGSSAGAVVAPILTADGAIGALSAEIRHGGETSEATQSLSAILAAQLANVLGQGPAAETAEPAESPAAAQA
jgi:hypothetical protein